MSKVVTTDKTERSTEYLASKEIHAEWENDYLNPAIDPFYEAAFAWIVQALKPVGGDSILDAGCGYCYHAARFARRGFKVTGVDFSPAALAAARQNLTREGLAVDLREGDLLALPFDDASFSFVNCWGVLMHIPEVERAIAELIRVLKPGGRIAISENSVNSLHVRVWERLVLLAKRIGGKPVPRRERRPQGLEEWRSEGLMVRKIDVAWLNSFMAARGLRLVDHHAGQFTELYTNLPGRAAKRLVYKFNEFWFRRGGSPAPALGQILVYEKIA